MSRLLAYFIANPLYIGLLALGLLVTGFGTGYYTKAQFDKADALSDLQAAISERDALAAKLQEVSEGYQTTISKLELKNRNLNKRQSDDAAKHPEYSGCGLSADGLRVITDAVTNAD